VGGQGTGGVVTSLLVRALSNLRVKWHMQEKAGEALVVWVGGCGCGGGGGAKGGG
jgi:hypothetical protein